MDIPGKGKIHTIPIPRIGGIAIYIAFIITVFILVDFTKELVGLLITSTFIFLMGVVDDIVKGGLPGKLKLVGQIGAASVLILFGVKVELITLLHVNIPITLLWIVGITNAFNLLDNMDGISAGLAIIAAIILSLTAWMCGHTLVSIVVAALAGGALGFLRYNFHPASIIMGDCGSTFLGFTLASLAIIGSWMDVVTLSYTLLVPIIILAIPIFDTSLVTIDRLRHGKSIFAGGKDHSTHRLYAMGLSQRQVAVVFYIISLSLGLIGMMVTKASQSVIIIVLTFLIIIALYVMWKLGNIRLGE